MIQIQASGSEPEDLTGTDSIRIMARIFELSTSGRSVTVSFGGAPKFVAFKNRIYKLVECRPDQFKKELPQHEDSQCLAQWDEEAA